MPVECVNKYTITMPNGDSWGTGRGSGGDGEGALCRLLCGEPAQMSLKTRSGRKPTTCTSPKPAVTATLTSKSQTWWLYKYSSHIYADATCAVRWRTFKQKSTPKRCMHTLATFTSVYIYQKLTNKSESPTKFEEDNTIGEKKTNEPTTPKQSKGQKWKSPH